jgi:hypothetical protein
VFIALDVVLSIGRYSALDVPKGIRLKFDEGLFCGIEWVQRELIPPAERIREREDSSGEGRRKNSHVRAG